jgi:sugar transferase (PEP-CTERM/EpsH1 system associated)
MKILFLTHQIPNPYSGNTIRPYHIIKKFSEMYGHKISLISFVTDSHRLYVDDIKKYCEDTYFFSINDEDNRSKLAIKTISNAFSPLSIYSKVVSKNGVFDISYYNKKEIQKKIDRIIEMGNFDAIYSDAGMAGYVAKSSLPKIVEPLDTNSKNWLQYCVRSKGLLTKSYWLFRYLQTFYRESQIFKRFDFCVVVTNIDKECLSKYLSNVLVIPNGVDIDYFKPISVEHDHPSLVFVGMMDGEKNIEAVLYFYSKIFPCVKIKCPTVKFYIVGKDPHSKVYELGRDNSVIVTGFVEDIRPYIARCSVFICTIVSGSGIKNKVLEAMAMGIPVVSTSIGALGIDTSFNKGIEIADDPEVFCETIVELLSNEALRTKIGKNARKIIEDKYSWESTTNNVDLLFKNMLQNNNN